MWHSNFPLGRKHFPCEAALLPHCQPVLKQPPAWAGLITQARSTLTITFPKRQNLEGDCNPRCTHGKKNVGQSNYSSQSKCASPEGGFSNGDAQATVTRLEPQVPPTTAVKKKSRILWNEEKEKRLMEFYVHSSNDPSRGCARRLLGEWTLAFPEYPTTSNALMKRMRLIKSRPKTTQVSNSDLQRLKRVVFLTLQHKGDSRLERVAPTSQPLQWGLKENQQELQQNLRESQRRPPWILTLIWKS